jgi:hypothetical protein
MTIHTLFLWRLSLAPLYKPTPFYPFKIRLLDTPPRERAQIGLSGSGRGAQPTAKQKIAEHGAPTATGRASPSKSQQTSSGLGGTSPPTEGTLTGAGTAGGTSSGSGTGEGASSGTGTAGATSTGKSTGQSGTRGLGPGSGVPPGAPGTFSTSIANAELESFIDGDYFDAFLRPDHYTLQAGNTRTNIPGTDVCVDGDQLRTKESLTISQTQTDHSKCHLRLVGGDLEKETCPAEANTTAVVFEGHAVSPLISNLNVCLEYDKSNCRIVENNDHTREICSRPNFDYTGTWAVGTIFVYNCKNWETRVYHLPLEYAVRYMVNMERNGKIIRKEVKRATYSVPRCD